IISLITALYATLFTITFLDVQKTMPNIYTISRITMVIILLDVISSLLYDSLLIKYYILPFLMLILIYAGYKSMRQGYKPARFFLAGWLVLTVAVFLNIFRIGYTYTVIDPLYIGAAVEAILFSLALSLKIHLVHKEKEEQKELLVHQSKLASMGEMIGNIAHQWRQPLTHLGYTLMNIGEAQKYGELNHVTLNKKIDEANIQLNFMSQTIDDFKDFYTPNKEKEEFSLADATQKTLELMQNSLKQNNIEIQVIVKEDGTIHNYKNKYKQVLLNLLSNAKDALIERNIPSPCIYITIDKSSVTVEDNGGGIKEEVMQRIYEPYFTTKQNNSGIGLYMSKMIIEKNMGARLVGKNSTKGIKFTIVFL
ncbi:MAG TPA: HAMP domain-containing histidine kinase, partial [Epsilonproteobacteria bacterium]|nr:HAMP domain-containing histidine kinase [Campylobacterota bacterium]